VCLASPERPLCSGDGLGASDTVSDCTGQKEALGDTAGNFFCPARPNLFGNGLGTRLEMLLGSTEAQTLVFCAKNSKCIQKFLFLISSKKVFIFAQRSLLIFNFFKKCIQKFTEFLRSHDDSMMCTTTQ
jgi:hypothetical protein